MSTNPYVHGLGIINFLKHKNFFITGSTGFMAKVFVEKLLREVPEVQKVYLLIRAKNADIAWQRLKTEIINCELFQRLKDEHGERYEEFMRDKLVPVIGNLSEPCLGMDADLAGDIANKIDVIINVAGNTGWQERYDILLDANVRGLSRLLDYAVNCKKRPLFLHVSTAYVTKKRSGVFLEQPIEAECNTDFDIEAEFKMVAKLASQIPNSRLPKEMAKFGLERAKFHGWAASYQLTKAMGEMVMTKLREQLPMVIIRPTLVESSFRDPVPGWIEGYKGIEPLFLAYGKGQLQGIFADPEAIIDIVPVDTVINAMIAAIANHGKIGEFGINIYHVSSSTENPLQCEKLFKYCHNYLTLHPFTTSRGEVIKVKEIEFFTSIKEYILLGIDSSSSNDKTHRMLVRMAAIFWPLFLIKIRLNNKNTQNLLKKMSSEEKKIFDFDVNRICLEDYIINIHLTSVRKKFLKEKILSPKL